MASPGSLRLLERSKTTASRCSMCGSMIILASPWLQQQNRNLRLGSPQPDHYRTLGLDQTATDKDVKAAYIKLCRVYHPDRNLAAARGSGSHQKFVEVQNAYDTLRSARLRAHYDRSLAYSQHAFAYHHARCQYGSPRRHDWHREDFFEELYRRRRRDHSRKERREQEDWWRHCGGHRRRHHDPIAAHRNQAFALFFFQYLVAFLWCWILYSCAQTRRRREAMLARWPNPGSARVPPHRHPTSNVRTTYG